MARRALVVWIDTVDETGPGRCGCCQHWQYDLSGIRTEYQCALFGVRISPDSRGYLIRHPDCLKAETFAGG